MAAEALGNATIRRVEWLTVALGGLGVAWASWHWGWRGGVGMALGAGISWINFRWLKGSVRAFGAVAVAQAPSPAADQAPSQPSVSAANEALNPAPGRNQPQNAVQPAKIPVSAYLRFFGRFALLLLVVYVILTRTWFPAVAVLAGLFASAAAVVVGLVWELVWSGVRANVSGNP